MASEKPNIIERSQHDFHVWLDEIRDRGGFGEDKVAAYHALRAGLHALRDTLTPDEALDLASQLPTIVRGVYFEGYHLKDRPTPRRSRSQFLEAVREHLSAETARNIDAERAVIAVFETLSAKLDDGQVRHARDMLHKDAQALWPEPASVH